MRYPNTIPRRIKTKGLLVILSLITISFLSSCEKEKEDEENQQIVYLPKISMQTPDSTNFTIGKGEEFIISVTAMINSQSTTSLSTLQILHNFNNTGYETILDSTIAIYGYLFMLNNYTCQANENEGTEDWKIIVYDNIGGADSVMITTEVVNLDPIVNFKSGEYEPGILYVDNDITFQVGNEFVFGVIAETGSSENLKRILVERIFENISVIAMFDSTINSPTFDFDLTTIAYLVPGKEEFICTVWDQSDRRSNISFALTTTPAAPNITTYEDKLMGAQNSNTGNSFASGNGAIYLLPEAKDNATEIDFLYFFGATTMATIAAPDDDLAALIYNDEHNGLQNWAVLNTTRFKTTAFTSAAFNAISYSNQLVAAVNIPTPPDQSRINNLAVGDVLAFETADDYYGLIRIDAITGTGAGTIEITVKVQ